jgi:hypothetical protein
MGIVICELDLTKLVRQKYQPEIITAIGPCKAKMTLENKEVITVVDEDPLLQQKMVDAGQDSLKDSAKEIADELKGIDKEAHKYIQKTGKMNDGDEFAEKFEKAYANASDAASTKANQAIDTVWKDYVKTHKDYKKYKLKVVAKILYSVVGIGTGIAGVFASGAALPTGGGVVTLLLSLVGTARSVSTGLQDLGTALKSAESAFTDVFDDTEKLKEEYDKMSKAAVTTKEIFDKAIDKFTTVSLNSIKKCEDGLVTFESKLGGVETEAHAVSKKLNKMLIDAEKAEKGIESSRTEYLIKALKAPFEKSVKSIDNAIDKIADLESLVKAGKDDADDLREDLQKLKEKVSKRVYTGAAIVIDLITAGAEIWGGNTTAKEFESAKNIVDTVQNSVQALHAAYDDYFKKKT